MTDGNAESGGRLRIGDVVSALFPLHRPGGREQEGYRPAVVVGLPELAGMPREGTANLRSPSVCLLDQVRALDVGRVRSYRGTLNAEEYSPIRKGLAKVTGDTR